MNVATWRCRLGKQDAPDTNGKLWIGEDFLQIVDEMGAAKGGDARKFMRPVVFKINAIGG